MAPKTDKSRTVRMTATHSFSGPEGSLDGTGNGAVLKGDTFMATPQRAYHLEAVKKAIRVDGSGVTAETTETKPTQQTNPVIQTNLDSGQTASGIPLDGLSIDKIRAAIAEGKTTASEALAWEMARPEDERRKTLLEELRLVVGESESDDDDDSGDSLNDEE